MARLYFDEDPSKFLDIVFPEIINDEIIFDVYDDVVGMTITSCDTNSGFSTNVEDNRKDLSDFDLQSGKYDIEIHTNSEGLINETIEIADSYYKIIFNKIEFDYELIRIDDENNQINNTNTENLAETFVSTDQIKIEFNQLNGCNLESDGNSFEDIHWKVRGVAVNDGNPTSNFDCNNSVCMFIPNPINRPINGSRQPNIPIKYVIETQILGLKKVFELEQDGKDVLRQEYIDYGTNWQPSRLEIFADNGIWNTGNYSPNEGFNTNWRNYQYNSGYIAAQGNNRFQEIWDELVENYEALCTEAGITDTDLNVNSCYRNPQRNRAVGSVLINSNHTRGHAMDVKILGIRTSQKWILLNDAAEQIDGVNGICEHNATQVTCGASNQTHVHLAW